MESSCNIILADFLQEQISESQLDCFEDLLDADDTYIDVGVPSKLETSTFFLEHDELRRKAELRIAGASNPVEREFSKSSAERTMWTNESGGNNYLGFLECAVDKNEVLKTINTGFLEGPIKVIPNKNTIADIESSPSDDLETAMSSKKEPKRSPTPKQSKLKNHLCEVCNRHFKSTYNLRIHKMIHTGELPFECEDCGKGFRQLNKLNIHLITHTNARQFSCDICCKTFRFQNYLAVHKRLHSADKPYKCKFCAEPFHSLHERRKHEKSQHADEGKTYACPICGEVQTAHCFLKSHIKRHINQRDHKCSRCEKSFFRRSQLKSHMLTHLSNEKPFECTNCQARFQQKSNFEQHLKLHASTKTYVCSVCDKAFAQCAGLSAHVRRHHRDMSMKPVKTRGGSSRKYQ